VCRAIINSSLVGITHRGGGLRAVWFQFVMVSAVGLAFFVCSLSLFRRSIAVAK